MSRKAVAWILLAVLAFAAVLLFNYWAAYQPLSTLVYSGMVLAIAGLANLIIPFRFLGVRKRLTGALLLVGGIVLAFGALSWPAATLRVDQPKTLLDEVTPQYQFYEKHSIRVHARPSQVIQAVQESTFGDLKSFSALMRVRSAALLSRDKGVSLLQRRVLEAFSASGYVSGSSDREVVMCGVVDPRATRRPEIHTLQDCGDYRRGGLRLAFNFTADDAGNGWSTVTTETRVMTMDDATRRGMGRYWRLIVPGSGLLRRQWLSSIKQKAESMPRT